MDCIDRLKQIRHIALDLDGTIYRGNSVFPETSPLLDLLERQGRVQETAGAMFRQGKALYDEKKYQEAIPLLRQALQLAERFGDEKLGRQCKSYLGAAELFL